VIDFVREPVMRVFLVQEKTRRWRKRLSCGTLCYLYLFHSGRLMSLVC